MYAMPSKICFINAMHAFSVSTNSSSITLSKSSPPPMLQKEIVVTIDTMREKFKSVLIEFPFMFQHFYKLTIPLLESFRSFRCHKHQIIEEVSDFSEHS